MDDRLKRPVEDSYYLMAYLGRVPLNLSSDEDRGRFNDYTMAIARAQAALGGGYTMDAWEGAQFWRAFVFLSNLASPATIESIRFSLDAQEEAASASAAPAGEASRRRRWVGNRYSWGTTVFLLVTLVLSLAAFVGSRALERFAADEQHWDSLVEIARLKSYGEQLRAQWDGDGQTLLVGTAASQPSRPERPIRVASGKPAGAANASPGNDGQPAFHLVVTIPPERVARLRAALPELLDAPAESDVLKNRVWHPACDPALSTCVERQNILLAEEFVFTLAALRSERRILEALLSPVTGSYDWLRSFRHPESDARDPPELAPRCGIRSPFPKPANRSGPQGSAPPEPDAMEALMDDPIALNEIFLMILCDRTPMPINLPPPMQSLISMDFKAKLFITVLNTYILPLMFGFLGAAVHVLRDINRRLDDFTMTRGLLRRYWARIILGGVSGAFIGLFFSADGSVSDVTAAGTSIGTLVTHLKGVALAFVAGFSVEVLFALLDRITQVFRDFAYGEAARAGQPGGGATVRLARLQ